VQDLDLLKELENRVVSDIQLVHDYVQIRVQGGAVLNLNNPLELDGVVLSEGAGIGAEVVSLRGCTITSVQRTNESFVLKFDGGRLLKMSLRPEDWRGPEALELHVPGEAPVVLTAE
jgi:hypothetical protein